jgi:hypothetical protein
VNANIKLNATFAVLKIKNRDGAVAQSVEQRTENPCVAGSIPAHTTSLTVKWGFFYDVYRLYFIFYWVY